jgi:hypothetical protein
MGVAARDNSNENRVAWSMIRKSGNRFSGKIMLKLKIDDESDSTQLNQTLVRPTNCDQRKAVP